MSENGASSADLAVWNAEEQVAYFRDCGLLNIPGEDGIAHCLCDALVGTPLPVHWSMRRDQHNRPFFWHSKDSISSWNHPLEATLREIAGWCRLCLTLPSDLLNQCTSKLQENCEKETATELRKWYEARTESGDAYYCNRETGQSMWEHPAEVYMPAQYAKTTSLKRLRDEKYVADIKKNVTANAPAGSYFPQLCSIVDTAGQTSPQTTETFPNASIISEARYVEEQEGSTIPSVVDCTQDGAGEDTSSTPVTEFAVHPAEEADADESSTPLVEWASPRARAHAPAEVMTGIECTPQLVASVLEMSPADAIKQPSCRHTLAEKRQDEHLLAAEAVMGETELMAETLIDELQEVLQCGSEEIFEDEGRPPEEEWHEVGVRSRSKSHHAWVERTETPKPTSGFERLPATPSSVRNATAPAGRGAADEESEAEAAPSQAGSQREAEGSIDSQRFQPQREQEMQAQLDALQQQLLQKQQLLEMQQSILEGQAEEDARRKDRTWWWGKPPEEDDDDGWHAYGSGRRAARNLADRKIQEKLNPDTQPRRQHCLDETLAQSVNDAERSWARRQNEQLQRTRAHDCSQTQVESAPRDVDSRRPSKHATVKHSTPSSSPSIGSISRKALNKYAEPNIDRGLGLALGRLYRDRPSSCKVSASGARRSPTACNPEVSSGRMRQRGGA